MESKRKEGEIIIKRNEILKTFIPVVEGLGEMLGKHYEIVLHDISNLQSSIIAIENGYITGREVGAPATDFLLEVINSEEAQTQDKIVNYTTQTKDGKQLKSSTILIRDEVEEVIGALCINLDLTAVEVAENFLQEISKVEENDSQEQFPENASNFLEMMIQRGLEKVDKPVSLLDKKDKLKIVEYLDKNNVFDIKGGIATLAEKLNVSKYTIYNYLEEINAQSAADEK